LAAGEVTGAVEESTIPHMPVLGVDGCRGGWIAASAPSLAAEPTFHLFATFAALVDAVRAPGSLAFVDVPIGLADARRACDGEARRLLGHRRACCVFTPPSRRALAGRSPAEIRRLNIAATFGRNLSSQALGIVDKIRQVDALMTPALQARIRETHPECTFAALSPGRTGLPHGKKSTEGRRLRLALLPPPFARAAATRPFPAGAVALDDYVDALAALSAALRFGAGEGACFPAGGEERDEKGLAMEIRF